MSRNFELLQRLEQRRGVSTPVEVAAVAPAPSKPVTAPSRAIIRPDIAESLGRMPSVEQEIQRLVRRLFFSSATVGPRLVSFADVEQANGSTAIAAKAGEVVAAEGRSVCLVDANFSSPLLHTHFGLPYDPITPSIARSSAHSLRAIAQSPGPAHLWVLTCARPEHGSVWQEFPSFLSLLRNQFDFILIDAGVVMDVATLQVAQQSDGLVLVIEANTTRRERAARAKEVLAESQISLLGAVLNNRTFPIPENVYQRL
jgi:Mrp family chromosome partitioning ATPase